MALFQTGLLQAILVLFMVTIAVPQENEPQTIGLDGALVGLTEETATHCLNVSADCYDASLENAFITNAESSDAVSATHVDYIGYVIVPSVLVFGLFGNSMTLAVTCYKGFRNMPSSLILRALAISDTTLILMLPFNKKFVTKLLQMDIRALSGPTCKLFFWAWKTSKMTSSWLVLLLALERLVAVVFPMKAHQLITRRNVSIGILLVYLGIGGFNAMWDSMVNRVIGGRCLPNLPDPGYESLAKPLVLAGVTLYAFIPALLILTFNFCIIQRLIQNARKRKDLTKQDLTQDATIRTTVMLMVVAFSFVILIVPIGTMHAVSLFSKVNIFETTEPSMVIFREVTQVMEQINYSINFFLYVLCCRRFRVYSRQLLTRPCRMIGAGNGSQSEEKTASTSASKKKTESDASA